MLTLVIFHSLNSECHLALSTAQFVLIQSAIIHYLFDLIFIFNVFYFTMLYHFNIWCKFRMHSNQYCNFYFCFNMVLSIYLLFYLKFDFFFKFFKLPFLLHSCIAILFAQESYLQFVLIHW